MPKGLRHIKILLLPLLLAIAACDTTSNLPAEEILYTGIGEVAYDKPPKRQRTVETDETEGVITALADAYTTVEGLLTGNAAAANALNQDENSAQARDSLKKATKKDAEAYATAKEEVEGVLHFAPNGAIMGSSHLRWRHPFRLWVYNHYLYAQRRFGKWMFNTFAATPRYVTTANPGVRTQVATNTLKNFGYFRGWAAHDTLPHPTRNEAKISYEVHPGVLFHLDTIRHLNFPHKADSLIRLNMRKTLLHSGEPFSVPNLDEERKRLSDIFRDNGYYYFQPEYITYRADTIQRPLLVQLQVLPTPTMPDIARQQFHIGNTFITVQKNPSLGRQGTGAPLLTDTIGRGSIKMAYGGSRRPPVKLGAVAHYLFYRKGDLYRHTLHQASQQKLSAMGIYSRLKVTYVPRDTTDTCDTLDILINATLDKPYDAQFEGKVTTKSNGQVGPGITYSMSRRNAFRGAETLTLKAWGSYEWQTGANIHGSRSLLNSYEYGASLNLTYPRIILPIAGRRLSRRSLSTTDYIIDTRWLNRANYFERYSLGARITYEYQRRRTSKHTITPFRLDYDVKLHSTARFDSIVAVNQALYASMRNQFVPAMEYTYTWKAPRHAPRTLTLNIKEAGNITSLGYALFRQPFSHDGKELLGVPFAQYIKASAQYTHLFRFTPRSGIATRVYAGAVFSYGNSPTAPYSDLFCIGGANSIRAFAARTIGPGGYRPENSNYTYIDQMGDLKLEANAEYRFPIIANLYGAIFLDAGNIWLIKSDPHLPRGSINARRLPDQIALGTGAGIRYDLDILTIRFDLGIGIHAPYQTTQNRYYNITPFHNTLGYHLAIGYPF